MNQKIRQKLKRSVDVEQLRPAVIDALPWHMIWFELDDENGGLHILNEDGESNGDALDILMFVRQCVESKIEGDETKARLPPGHLFGVMFKENTDSIEDLNDKLIKLIYNSVDDILSIQLDGVRDYDTGDSDRIVAFRAIVVPSPLRRVSSSFESIDDTQCKSIVSNNQNMAEAKQAKTSVQNHDDDLAKAELQLCTASLPADEIKAQREFTINQFSNILDRLDGLTRNPPATIREALLVLREVGRDFGRLLEPWVSHVISVYRGTRFDSLDEKREIGADITSAVKGFGLEVADFSTKTKGSLYARTGTGEPDGRFCIEYINKGKPRTRTLDKNLPSPCLIPADTKPRKKREL